MVRRPIETRRPGGLTNLHQDKHHEDQGVDSTGARAPTKDAAATYTLRTEDNEAFKEQHPKGRGAPGG
jgi:hypothetical protein